MNRFIALFHVLSSRTWWQLAVAFGLFLVPTYAFVELADEVRDMETVRFDEALLRVVNSISSPTLDPVVAGLTELGGAIGVLVITLGLCAILVSRKMLLRAVLLAVGVGGGAILNVLLKSVFQRDRPELWERLVTENSYSFPSGHAMASGALAISLIVIFWPTKWRWIVTIAAGLYMILIGLTRLYLGVHYPTDILAGWMVSGAWIALMMFVLKYRKRITTLMRRSGH